MPYLLRRILRAVIPDNLIGECTVRSVIVYHHECPVSALHIAAVYAARRHDREAATVLLSSVLAQNYLALESNLRSLLLVECGPNLCTGNRLLVPSIANQYHPHCWPYCIDLLNQLNSTRIRIANKAEVILL